MRALRRSGARLIFDLYVPRRSRPWAASPATAPRCARLLTAFAIDRLVDALRSGDHFVCASEKQRDLLARHACSPSG